jgi:hypothetical protein
VNPKVKSEPAPTMKVETITPTDAHTMLGTNVHNRHVKRSLVLRLANAMRRDDWTLNGETIKISVTGKLLDGQHRLLAIIESGCTIRTFVVRGLPDETQQTVDIGITRSNADVLALEGYASRSRWLAATLRYLKLLETGLFRATGGGESTYVGGQAEHAKAREPIATFSPQELMDVLLDYPYIYDSMDAVDGMSRSFGGSAAQYAALHAWLSKKNPDAARDFFDHLVNGTGLEKGDAIWALRRYLETRKADRVSSNTRTKGWSRVSRLYVHALFIKAWNAYRAGKKVRTLSWKTNEPLPEPVK